MVQRLRERQEWQFFALLPKSGCALSAAWWTLLVLGGALPAVFAVATGVMVNAVQQSRPLTAPLVLIGLVFVSMLVVSPLLTAVSMNLGNQVSALLNDQLGLPHRIYRGGCRPSRSERQRPLKPERTHTIARRRGSTLTRAGPNRTGQAEPFDTPGRFGLPPSNALTTLPRGIYASELPHHISC